MVYENFLLSSKGYTFNSNLSKRYTKTFFTPYSLPNNLICVTIFRSLKAPLLFPVFFILIASNSLSSSSKYASSLLFHYFGFPSWVCPNISLLCNLKIQVLYEYWYHHGVMHLLLASVLHFLANSLLCFLIRATIELFDKRGGLPPVFIAFYKTPSS